MADDQTTDRVERDWAMCTAGRCGDVQPGGEPLCFATVGIYALSRKKVFQCYMQLI